MTGGSVQINVLANDSATSPATLQAVTVTSGPAHGTVGINGGIITYTPTIFTSGTDSFTYTVTDSEFLVSNTATVRITITAVPLPPLANNDSFTITAGVQANLQVLLNDTPTTSAIDPASITIVTPPGAGATATVLPADGTIHFTASAGVYSVQYTVKDTLGAASNIATAIVTAVAANVAPSRC